MTIPAAVYRLYDAEDNLLYVGSSQSLSVRYTDHRRTKPWWPQVHRKTETWYPNRDEAYCAERRAIRDERPRHNLQGIVVDPTEQELAMIELGDQFLKARETFEDLRQLCYIAAAEGRAAGLSIEKIGIEKITARDWISKGKEAARNVA